MNGATMMWRAAFDTDAGDDARFGRDGFRAEPLGGAPWAGLLERLRLRLTRAALCACARAEAVS